MRFALACAAFALTITGALATESGDTWRQNGAPGTAQFSLSYGNSSSGDPAYLFDCSGSAEVAITQSAVTELRDINTGQRVADQEAVPLVEGAAFMGLGTDVARPKLVPATATRNQHIGWDLTIRLDRRDRAFASLPFAGMVSLLTTGHTVIVPIGADDRSKIGEFVHECVAAAPVIVAENVEKASVVPVARPAVLKKKKGRPAQWRPAHRKTPKQMGRAARRN